ncbi:hypothetical protein FIU97_14335 [Roseivivax sp. THAF40]|uniref:hypothetical protein n=1 Tax=unclassified Roseivivax TaxID=2639302 RepID=UPI0012AA2C28|nr:MULTISPECIES: hypothetical protein [unclassified Roseivivax]QFS83924.1 hypothetical protein FIV09_13895 [Roseivivax sp. THAF197b]QFT47756.1 hypothetical protein FIU97_14335 [Roseivivax sp. THAF40]
MITAYLRVFLTMVFLLIGAVASAGSLALSGGLFAARAPLFEGVDRAAAPDTRNPSSLFAGREGTTLFRQVIHAAPLAAFGDTAATHLRHLIADAEAGPMGYDAVQHGARIRPKHPPTQMTIAEIYAWIDRTPGQPHAIGRYQFIPATLRRLVRKLGIDPATRFSASVQDRLADQLLEEAGFSDMRRGATSTEAFMHNLAKIWAGLPTANGRSYYDGYAGNSATMTWDVFRTRMDQIFPG